MKRISPILAACVVTGIGLIGAAVVLAQLPVEKPPEGAFLLGMPGVTQGRTELVAVSPCAGLDRVWGKNLASKRSPKARCARVDSAVAFRGFRFFERTAGS